MAPCGLRAAGVYPFAGRECARAFAKMSTELEDCVADVSGLGLAEQDSLASMEYKLRSKYPIVGKVVPDAR